MSVKYDVVYKDGKKLSTVSVCFGKMESHRWSELASGSDGTALLRRPASDQAFIQFHTGYGIHPMWFKDSPEYNRDWPRQDDGDYDKLYKIANRKYLEEMKELVKDLPMLKGLVTIHPLLGVVRVHVKRNKADEIMLALFLFRNLAHYGSNCYPYRYFRAAGYRPRIAAVMSHLIQMERGSTFNPWSICNQEVGEYNWCNPNTFGKQAFLRMVSQDDNTVFDFVQQEWREQYGYRREGAFRREQRIFDERYVGRYWDYDNDCHDVQENRDSYGEEMPENKRKYWCMVDALSIPGDEPIVSGQKWNPVRGFYFGDSPNSTISQSELDEVMSEIDALLEEHNIPKSI